MVMHCRRDAISLNMVFQKYFITVVVITERDPKCGSFSLHKRNEISLSNKYTLFFFLLRKSSKKHIVGQFFSCTTVVPMGWGCGFFLFGFNTNSTC